MIAFEQLVARYPHAPAPAVNGVSLVAPDGILTAVVGPNGSGKSTLVRALLGRVPVSRGAVRLDGQRAEEMSRRHVARHVAVVTQREEPAFPMRVRDYIALGKHPAIGTWGRAPQQADAVEAVAATAGVLSLLNRPTDALSGGEWQRVRVARALAQDAPNLVMDEPTAALDVGHEMEMFELLSGLAAAGRSILVISHQLNLVARFARHVVLLHQGRVAADGSPDEVMQAQVLESVYDCPLVIVRDPAIGAPTLLPLRRPRPVVA